MTHGIIVCGGKQTRMQEFTLTPKVLLEFNGKTNLQRLLDSMPLDRFYIICSQFNHDQIKAFIDTLPKAQVRYDLIVDEHGLGSGGCLSLIPKCAFWDDHAIVFGDIYFEDSSLSFMEVPASIAVHKNDHPQDSDSILGLSPTGLFFMSERSRLLIPRDTKLDLVKDIFGKILHSFLVYRADGASRDFGTPERYQKLIEDLS